MNFLPTNGIKTGNIGGHSYYRSKLIYGTTQLSGTLPKIYQKHLTYIKQLTKINNRLSDDKFLNIYSKNKFKNSFKKSTQIIYEKSTINLTNKTIIGNIIIQSESKIIVDQTSNLTDVILLAPIIEIKNNVKGVFQAIASKKIIVGNHCNLLYPSALVVQENSNVFLKDASEKQPKIFVKEHCTIGGLVGYLGNIKNHNPQIYISSNVTIKGEIYCKQNLDLRGIVYGTVYTANFVAQQNGSSYQNHLYNGQIIANSLANKYAGLDFKNHINNVVQWLY